MSEQAKRSEVNNAIACELSNYTANITMSANRRVIPGTLINFGKGTIGQRKTCKYDSYRSAF